jgi:hypothetical protein
MRVASDRGQQAAFQARIGAADQSLNRPPGAAQPPVPRNDAEPGRSRSTLAPRVSMRVRRQEFLAQQL